MKSKTVTPKNTSHIERKIDSFIDSLEKYNSKRPRPRSEKDYHYLRFIFNAFVKDQNKRAKEVSSRQYAKALEVANKQFSMKTMWNLCIDGRVLTILAHGVTARIGNSIRVPGGMLREFIRGEDGRLRLKDDSNFARLLTGAFARFRTNSIAEVFDSHIGCAARLAEEELKGRVPEDAGLMADVSHKKQIAAATVAYCREKFGNSRSVLTIQTTFDPKSGFMYMGLETELAYSYALENGGFIPQVLAELVRKGRIISTEQLVNEQGIKSILDQNIFPLDWKHDYVQSARLFWERVALLKSQLSPVLEQKLKLVYRHLTLRGKALEEELEERVMLLLTNLFSGYLHHLTVKKDRGHSHFYPYGLHREEGVKVSEGGYPPYGISMFVVFSFDEKNLPSSIELATALVRKNRLEGRVRDQSKTFDDVQAFAEASVPIIVQEIMRDPIDQKQWRTVAQVSWDDLPANWEQMTSDDFLDYLARKADMSYGLIRAINNLRKRMAILYEPGTATSSHLVEHYKVALPTIVDHDRKNWFIVPFVKLGFE